MTHRNKTELPLYSTDM